MPGEQHTSERTSLGLVLQYLVEDSLTQQGITFKPNAKYHDGFIKPDVLIPGLPPLFSVHVTATGADNSLGMKKWRYIDEVLQMRSVWGNKFVAINVLFGPIAGYQAGDRELLKRLFDREVIVHVLDPKDATFKKALHAVASAAPGDKSRGIATALLADSDVMRTVGALGKAIKTIIDAAQKSAADKSVCDALANFLKTRKGYVKGHPPTVKGNAAWKRSILRFLAVTPNYWPTLLSLDGKELELSKLDQRLIREATRAKLIRIREGAGGLQLVSLTTELGITIRAGLTAKLLESVKKAVHANPRRKYELDDLWDNGKRSNAAVREVAKAYGLGHAQLIKLITYSIEQGGSPTIKHHRTHILDVVLAALGLSQNQLQDRYPGPGVGVADPIRNIVPRTEIAIQALKSGKLIPSVAAASIVKAISSELGTVDWKNIDVLVERYSALRVFNLTKGSSVDPLEEFVYAELIHAGWTLGKPALVSRNAIVGKVKTVFSAVGSKKGRLIVLKCLFGDTGADHKAEEMEARMRMLRLDPPVGKELITVFVADGKWNSSNLTGLVLGGWDHVVGVAELPKLLHSLS